MRRTLALALCLSIPTPGFCANVRAVVPVVAPRTGGAPVSVPSLSLNAASLAVPSLSAGSLPAALAGALPSASLALPSALLKDSPSLRSGDAPKAAMAAPKAAMAAPRAGVLPGAVAGAPEPAPASVLKDSPSLRSGVDPRGPAFEDRAWDHALSQGLVRAAAPVDGVSAASNGAPPAASSLAPAGGGASSAGPPSEPPKPRSVLSRGVLGFLSSFLVVQVTVESLALVVPQMTDPLKQGFLALGAVSAIGYTAYSIGSYFGGRIVQRFGIKSSYRAVLTLRALIWTAAAFMFNANLHSIPVAGLAGLFALDYFVHAIGRVAEGTLQVSWFKDKPLASARFGTARDFIEYGTVFTTLGTGLIISIWGFSPIVFATPVLFGLSAVITYFLKDLPGKPQQELKTSFLAGFKALFKDKTLLKLWAPQLLINNFFYGFYYIFATAFSVLASNGAPEQSALVSSALMGVFGIGAVAGTLIMTWLGNRIDKKTSGLPEDQKAAAQKAMLAKTGAASLRWSAAALLGVFAFAFPALLGTFIWPVYAVTPALILIGMTAQVALGHLDPMFKERMPKETAGHILGAQRTLTYLSYALTFIVWGALFQLLGANAFLALGAVSVVVAGLYLLLAKKISK